jgi:hypothetical protein
MTNILGAQQHSTLRRRLSRRGYCLGANAEAGHLCHVESRGPDRRDTCAQPYPSLVSRLLNVLRQRNSIRAALITFYRSWGSRSF